MIRAILMTFVLLCSGQIMAQKIYKWVDENGQIHYASQKPAGQEAETVKVKKGPKVVPKAEAKADNSTPADAANDEELDAEAEAEARAKLSKADAVNRKKQCETAKSNYAALNATVRVVRTNEKGETVRMTDDERVKALATAQKGIDRYCN